MYIYSNGAVSSREILVQAVKRWSSHNQHAGTSLDAPWSFTDENGVDHKTSRC